MGRARGRRGGRGQPRSRRVRLLLLVAALGLVAFLYTKPLRSYFQTGHELARRRAEVRELRHRKQVLEERLAGSAGDAWIVESARRLGLVKPGERLFIVKGIREWERAHGVHASASSG